MQGNKKTKKEGGGEEDWRGKEEGKGKKKRNILEIKLTPP